MKSVYQQAQAEIIYLQSTDMITASDATGDNGGDNDYNVSE